ncbi:sodium-dependent transporter [Methanofollis aquaemaris]|uniref:Transporter n=1 Tax=Methanofollis aquaemaris TaxID=126734 RepID=A0A8A3S7S3_9EURY|nr:sodium-dependent transporter [Methanofollis aquaemaris]QSZ67781.1 sodium-dependent transporter [Methanofollis aquaemaris]
MAEDQRWSSRKMFILAVVSSAIGLGNLWRFPYVAYDNGGGAFLIPYLLALFTVGIPLLILETGVGYKTHSGPPLAFKRLLGKWSSVIGWAAVLVAFLIVTYYSVIVAWSFDYLGFSFNLAWGNDPSAFFYDDFLQISDGFFSISGLNLVVLAGAILAWIWIYLSIFKGVRSVEKMVWVTVVVPWLLIIIFVLRGITLPGAMDGLAYYLTPDFSALLDPGVWIAAYGQVFYSMSIGMAIIIAYSRFLGEKSDVVKNAVVIAIADCFTSIFAGIAVFSTLGYLAYTHGVSVTEVVRSGIELAFVTYPAVISALPVLPQLFGILFFAMLITLGVGSAFSLVQAVSASLTDYIRTERWILTGVICVAAFAVSLIYMTDAGLLWLDVIDHYVNNFLVLMVGLAEAVVIGYGYGAPKLREFVNKYSDWKVGRWWDVCIWVVIPLFLGLALIINVIDGIADPYGDYPLAANLIGWAEVIVLPLLAVVLAYVYRNHEGVGVDEKASK